MTEFGDFRPTSANMYIYENGKVIAQMTNMPYKGTNTVNFPAQALGTEYDVSKRYEVDIVFDEGVIQKVVNFLQNRIKPSKVRIALEWQAIATDYNRDGKIDAADMQDAGSGKVHYFWINDNDDRDDVTGNSIPGSGKDWLKPNISGTRDLVDYFSVHLDIAELLKVLPPANYIYRLKHQDSAIAFAETDMSADNSKKYLTEVAKAKEIGGEGVLSSTPGKKTYPVVSSGTNINIYQLQWIQLNKGLLLAEGRFKTNKPLVLEVVQKNTNDVAFRTQMALSIDKIENMFRHKNLVQEGDGPPPIGLMNYGAIDRLDEPSNYPDAETSDKHFIFVHGYNVNGEQARGWNAEMFKRLYWSGSRAKFWGVTWYGWDTQDFSIVTLPFTRNFHINVQHALKTALAFTGFINATVGGQNVTVAAHSLGNMIASSAIAEKGAKVANYLMIDAAVPIEAYDESIGKPSDDSLSQPVSPASNSMIVWGGYKAELMASEWYRLFPPSDERNKLTWRGRFAAVKTATNAYNFYSSGEDVLANHNGTPFVANIFTEGSGRFAWGLQEKLKGGLPTGWMLGSNYGGWSRNQDVYNEWVIDSAGHTINVPLTPEEANKLTQEEIRKKPFFKLSGNDLALLQDYPAGSNYAKVNHDRLLAEAIPALSPAAGSNSVDTFGRANEFNFDMQSNFIINNQWPPYRVNVKQSNDWWHSDVRDVSFPYVKELFFKLVELGGQ